MMKNKCGQAAVLEEIQDFSPFFWNGRSINAFIFIENFSKKKDPSTMISHIKNTVYQWVYGYTKREYTHTISKYVQVVCELKLANSLYTQRL